MRCPRWSSQKLWKHWALCTTKKTPPSLCCAVLTNRSPVTQSETLTWSWVRASSACICSMVVSAADSVVDFVGASEVWKRTTNGGAFTTATKKNWQQSEWSRKGTHVEHIHKLNPWTMNRPSTLYRPPSRFARRSTVPVRRMLTHTSQLCTTSSTHER